MVAEEGIRVVRSGGNRINYRRPVFSADGKYIISVSGDFIKVYSTATQECIHVLQGHKHLVTGIALNPNNHLQLYSCSLDKTVKLWDFTDGIMIKSYYTGFRMFGFCAAGKSDCIYAIIAKDNKEKSGIFQLVSLKLPKSAHKESKVKEISVIFEDISNSPKCISLGRDDEYIAAGNGLSLLVYFFKSKKTLRFQLKAKTKYCGNNTFTVVKCHPEEDCIATGHRDGKIRLWRNFSHEKEYTFSTHHWHSDAVADLAFSVQGTMLLSGGIESVLVQWSLNMERGKEFLPRLGAAIEHISTSPDGSLHCTSHSDNQITIIEVCLKVKGIILGLVKGTTINTGLVFDPRSKALVLNGKPGHLQFYSLHDDKQLYNLDIVQQEFVNQTGLHYMDLTKTAFSSKGNWLATIEELQGDGTDVLNVQMKLWEFNEQLQSFELNTTIGMPHEDKITSLVFQNQGSPDKDVQTLVTTGNDGHFKVWILRDNSDIYRQSSGWSCDFVGSYHRNKATDCCFSEDGSLLAVGFEEVLTVWDTSNWDLKYTFCQPPGKIRNVCFGRFSCLKYLLASTDSGLLNCWDLLTCKLKWSAQINVTLLVPDHLSETIAAFSLTSGQSNLFIFHPSDPMPLYIHKDICQGRVQCAVFVPRTGPVSMPSEKYRWLSKSELYFLTKSQDLLTFSTKSQEERLKPLRKQLISEESLPYTPFYTLFGKKNPEKAEQSHMDSTKATSLEPKIQSVAIKELLHTPAHVLPPTSMLCTVFVNSLLICKQNKCTELECSDTEMEVENEKEDEDEDFDEMGVVQPPISASFPNASCRQSKGHEKELRSIRKIDFSWISTL